MFTDKLAEFCHNYVLKIGSSCHSILFSLLRKSKASQVEIDGILLYWRALEKLGRKDTVVRDDVGYNSIE